MVPSMPPNPAIFTRVSGPCLLLAMLPFSLCSECTVSAPTNIILSKSSNKVLVEVQCYCLAVGRGGWRQGNEQVPKATLRP